MLFCNLQRYSVDSTVPAYGICDGQADVYKKWILGGAWCTLQSDKATQVVGSSA